MSKFESNIKTHVMFYINALNGGGAEMHFLRLLVNLDPARFHATLVVGRKGGAYDQRVPDNVSTIYLEEKSHWKLVRGLRRIIVKDRPHLLFSVMDNANLVCLAATRLLRSPPKTVVGVQIPPSVEYDGPWWSRRANLLRSIRALYPKADCVVALSRGVQGDLLSISPALADKSEVIYNAGFDQDVVVQSQQAIDRPPGEQPLLVACGRLTRQKGFPYLINAMVEIRKRLPAHLWIVGEGEDRDALTRQIRETGLSSCVRLLGFQQNPYRYMSAADVFVLSSLWEGFGNVIVEAMACGVPVVSTACPHGPEEILCHEESGLLVPVADARSLAAAVVRVLDDGQLRSRLSQVGQQRAMEFSAEQVARSYEATFLRVVGEHPEVRIAA